MRVSRNLLRRTAAALFLSLSVAIPAGAKAPAPGAVSGITIENFGRVNDAYYRGSQPEGTDYAALAAIGVKTIVDLQNDGDRSEPAAAQRAGLKFLSVPMSSTSVPSTAQIDQFLRIVNDPVNQPVYVHCKGGRHRTGTLTAIYRMTQESWTAERAFQEMLQYDFDYGFGHGGQKKFVYAFGADLDRTRVTTAAKATTQD